MAPNPRTQKDPDAPVLYCPQCGEGVPKPITCGDCGAVICPKCGSPLESSDELGIG